MVILNIDEYLKISDSHYFKFKARDLIVSQINSQNFQSLLELGCGDGELLGLVHIKRKIGVEISPEMISKNESKNSKVIQHDITKTSLLNILGDDSFDCIVANFVFMELKKEEILSVLKNVKKLLSVNGKFLFTITDPRTLNLEFPNGYTSLREMNMDEVEEGVDYKILFKEKGKVVDVGIIDYYTSFKSYEKMLNDLKFGFKIVEIKDDFSGSQTNGKNHSLLFICEIKK